MPDGKESSLCELDAHQTVWWHFSQRIVSSSVRRFGHATSIQMTALAPLIPFIDNRLLAMTTR
jgi:hypothetical protein